MSSARFSLRTVPEEGPPGLASIQWRERFLLLAHKCVPPDLLCPSQLPDLLQTVLQILNWVIGPVVHQTSEETLEYSTFV